MKPTISVLVSARMNSKYLAKFLFGYFQNTDNINDTEVLVMLNKNDTWNQELIDHFSVMPYNVKFDFEDLRQGRAGLHNYFNRLLGQARGDWIVYFCEDHFIIKSGWDTYIKRLIGGQVRAANPAGDLKHPYGQLNPKDVWILVPKFDNAGSMNHIVSRGYVKALEGVIGRHGWIDSYINDVATYAWGKHPKHLIRIDDDLFHDFTHDHPNPMSDAHLQSVVSGAGKKLPEFGSDEYYQLVQADADRLNKAIKKGE